MSDVNTPSAEATTFENDWALYDGLLGGTSAMRKAGEKFLPKRPMETRDDYNARLSIATLFPAYSETISNMTGRVFAKPITFDDSVPKWIVDEVVPDIDLQGRNFQSFFADTFAQALGYGMSFVLIDSPIAQSMRSLADQQAAKVRPYAVQIGPRRILGWQVDNTGILVQVRVSFERTIVGPWETQVVPQIRVFERGKVSVFEQTSDKKEWFKVSEVAMPLSRIPIIPIYTARVGLFQSVAPLRELAFLNAKHWRMQSGNDAMVETASVPILAIIGVESTDPIIIGAKNAVSIPLNGDMKYVEHTGKAIEAGRVALDALKTEMRQAGAKMLEQSQTIKIAAQADEESKHANSRLAGIVKTFQDALNDVLDLIAEWRKESTGGTCQTNPNLDSDLQSIESMNVLMQMRNGNGLSEQTVFDEAQRRGMLSDTLTWEIEQERLANQPIG